MLSKLGPAARYGLTGAGIGALYGGASSMAQGESPSQQLGSALGGALLGAAPFALAGKYAPQIKQAIGKGITKAGQKTSSALSGMAQKVPGVELEGYTGGLGTIARDVQTALQKGAAATANIEPSDALIRNVSTGGLALAGIGGALGGASLGSAIGGQFDPNLITDPELVGSSNTPMARASTPTLRYLG